MQDAPTTLADKAKKVVRSFVPTLNMQPAYVGLAA